jgi:hypothetical protein
VLNQQYKIDNNELVESSALRYKERRVCALLEASADESFEVVASGGRINVDQRFAL